MLLVVSGGCTGISAYLSLAHCISPLLACTALLYLISFTHTQPPLFWKSSRRRVFRTQSLGTSSSLHSSSLHLIHATGIRSACNYLQTCGRTLNSIAMLSVSCTITYNLRRTACGERGHLSGSPSGAGGLECAVAGARPLGGAVTFTRFRAAAGLPCSLPALSLSSLSPIPPRDPAAPHRIDPDPGSELKRDHVQRPPSGCTLVC